MVKETKSGRMYVTRRVLTRKTSRVFLTAILTLGFLINGVLDFDVLTMEAETPLSQYKVMQEGKEWAVAPVIEAESALSFYNYYSESGHTPFMESHASKIYLYEDTTTGELSLIFHQGMDDDTPGTMCATYDFEGIPPGAYASVSDDPEGIGSSPRSPELDEFSLDLEPEGYHCNTYNSDGGVLSGLPTTEPWSITLYPEFMTEIYSWKYVMSNGTEISLEMDKPVTIELYCLGPSDGCLKIIGVIGIAVIVVLVILLLLRKARSTNP